MVAETPPLQRAFPLCGPRFDQSVGPGYTAKVPLQVLIVDDDPWILKMVTTVLQKRGYTIHTAVDGQDAYLKAIEIKPDLIITDIMMPKMDGWTLVRSLRARSDLALTPVIFLSALSGDEDRIQGFRLGADDYLPKPFRFEELDLRVSNALRKRKAMAETMARVAEPASTPPQPQQAGGAGGIQGSLEQLGLSSLLVMVEMERKSGILVLRREQTTARVFLKGGKVIAARLEDGVKGGDAVYKLLEWVDGRFEFTAMDVDMEDEMKGMSTQFLLMEGARLIDEAAAGVKK